MLLKELKNINLKNLYSFNNIKYSFASQKPLSNSNNKNNGSNKKQQLSPDSIGNLKGLIYSMRKDSKVSFKQRTDQKALHQYNKKIYDNLVELTLYMQHNNWKSQFIYSLLNYNKLGFKIVSDYAFLDSSSYMLELRNIKQQDRWPTIRVIIGLKPKMIVTGAKQIENFFVQNQYFQQRLLKDTNDQQFIKNHIDNEVLPYMESLLWHPTLTYQTTFHTDPFYHQSQQKNYMLVGILVRNFSAVGKAIASNLIKIMKQKERYLKSKQKLTTQMKNLSELYLIKNEYFGGQKPNFIDFYLFSHLKTKWDSKYFKNYVQDEISHQFKRWLLRMGWSCEYVKDRVTVI